MIDGKEAKTWREQAMQAGKDRAEGKWDDWKQQQREEEWGVPDENVKPRAKDEEVNGNETEVADDMDSKSAGLDSPGFTRLDLRR